MRYLAFCALILVSFIGYSYQQASVCRADIGLIIDDSGSITEGGQTQNWDAVKNFLKLVVQKFIAIGDAGTHFAANRFSNRANMVFQLNSYSTEQEYTDAITRMRYSGGNTNTSGGLLTMLDVQFSEANGNRRDARDIFILITDGKPTRDVEKTAPAIERIHNANIRLIGVGVTDAVDEEQMRKFVRDPDCTKTPNDYYCTLPENPYADSYLFVREFSQLESILENLIDQSCATIRPTGPPPTPRPRISTLPPPGRCTNSGDVLFILDASGSIGYNNFMKQKEFIKSIILDFTIGSQSTRVSVLTFTEDANINFRLNTYNNRPDIIKAIDEIQFTSNGRTRTDKALARAYNEVFQPGNGARGNQPDIAVLLTDGGSNDKQATMREIHIAKTRGIHFIVLGIGNWLDEYELQSLASYSYTQNLIQISSFDDLPSVRTRLRDLICNSEY